MLKLKGYRMSTQRHFDALIKTIDHLLGPDGCQWDKEQTISTLCSMVAEEVYEVIDAINDRDAQHLADELGDVLLTCLFLVKAASKEFSFPWESPLEMANQKLIRRHPHIFLTKKNLTNKEIEAQWESLKKEEHTHQQRKILDGIPRSLPALAMTQKIVRKLKKAKALTTSISELGGPSRSEEDVLAKKMLLIVAEAEEKGFHAEEILRQFCRYIQTTHSGSETRP
jgi:MazG family protein